MRRFWTLLLIACAIPAFADITVSTVTPAAGLTSGGTIVHLHGTNLFAPELLCAPPQCRLFVNFGEAFAEVIFDSAGEIVVIAPPHAAGPVDLTVNVPLEPPLILKNAFSYQDPATDTVRLLLPIAAGTQGIFNTTWQTDILAHNEMASPVVIAGTTVPPLATQNFTLTASDLAYLQMPVAAATSSPVLRVEVTTGAPADPPIWAFLTLTNNTTQNVTTITPNVAVTPTSAASVLTAGRWAHNGYCMTVSSLGDVSVSVALQCGGAGSFSLPSIDGDGHFEADGSFTFGSGACCPSPEPAHYSGLVTNGTVALTIRTKVQTIGPFTLIYGSTEPCWFGTCP